MKKLILSASLITTFMLYVVYGRTESEIGYATPSARKTPPTSQIVPVQLIPTTPTSPPASSPMGGGMMPPAHMGMYRDGEYTGSVVDVYYGNVEVKAIIQMGKLADVKFLQYPNDRQTSISISSQALPALRSEAIKAQNANVDVISGATATSEGFVSSLGDALVRAKV